MKTIYKNSIHFALSGLCCLFFASTASAQHSNNNSGGGGGGGSRPSVSSGSSSAPSARPSGGGGGVSVRPPSSGNVGVARPQNSGGAGSYQRGSAIGAPQRNAVYVDRSGNIIHNNVGGQRVGIAPQNGNYAPRVGVTSQNGVYAQRIGVAANSNPRSPVSGGVSSYRTAPQIGYGRGAVGYFGNHGYYHYNRGYYGSYYLPRLGFSCAVLPYGYYPFYYGDFQYYYSDGLYYQFDNNQYTVVEPPIGAEITQLPENAQSIVINGQQYYELNGVYYQPVTKDDGSIVYMIAGKDGVLNTSNVGDDQQPQGPQIGDIVLQLPPDCRKIKVSGQKMYVSPDGVYYQQQTDANGNVTYKIVGLPSDEPDQN